MTLLDSALKEADDAIRAVNKWFPEDLKSWSENLNREEIAQGGLEESV
jgi:hypothetical protein